MRMVWTKPLFPGEELDDPPSLGTVRELLHVLPDGRLLDALRGYRCKGRNDYPGEVLWGVCVLTLALRHTSFDACLAELRRNTVLRQLIGIESEIQVPRKWNLSHSRSAGEPMTATSPGRPVSGPTSRSSGSCTWPSPPCWPGPPAGMGILGKLRLGPGQQALAKFTAAG